jgi:general secretion pathway protein F
MVEAGEASGTLEIVLLRLADFTESQVKLKNKIKGAMTYPVIMAVFGFVMMNVIFIFVIPKIAKIFISMKKELPLITKICIGISNFLVGYWWLVILGIIFTIYATMKYINTAKGQSHWHAMQLKLPILGILVKMINVSRFCSTLGTLMNSGVPILTALTIVKNLIPNVHMKDAVEKGRCSGFFLSPVGQTGGLYVTEFPGQQNADKKQHRKADPESQRARHVTGLGLAIGAVFHHEVKSCGKTAQNG